MNIEYKDLINDITNLKELELQKKYYNYDLDKKDLIIDGTWFYVPLSHFLSNLELNKDLTIEYYKYLEKINEYDAYNHYIDFLTDVKKFKEIRTDYTYNDCDNNNMECDIQYCLVKDTKNDVYYIAIEVHNGGDARCGFSYAFIYEYTGDIDYMDLVMSNMYICVNDLSFDIQGYEVNNIDGTYMFDYGSFIDSLDTLIDNNVKLNIEGALFEY